MRECEFSRLVNMISSHIERTVSVSSSLTDGKSWSKETATEFEIDEFGNVLERCLWSVFQSQGRPASWQVVLHWFFFTDRGQHVCDQLWQAIRRLPAPILTCVRVIKPHWPAVRYRVNITFYEHLDHCKKKKTSVKTYPDRQWPKWTLFQQIKQEH